MCNYVQYKNAQPVLDVSNCSLEHYTKNTWKHHKFILKKVLRFILKKNCQMCLLSWKNVSYPKEQKTIFKKIFQPNS